MSHKVFPQNHQYRQTGKETEKHYHVKKDYQAIIMVQMESRSLYLYLNQDVVTATLGGFIETMMLRFCNLSIKEEELISGDPSLKKGNSVIE